MSELSGKFSKGNEFRECANEGLQLISTAFDADTDSYLDTDQSWKNRMLNLLNESIFNEDGSIDWALVKHILSKDADAISDSEYLAVTNAYLNANTEELEDFFMMCSAPEDESKFKWTDLYLEDKIGSNQTVFVIDTKKINNICDVADQYQATLLALIKSDDVSDDVKSELRKERDAVLQKITTAQTMNGINTFYGTNSKDDYFSFKLTQGSGNEYNIEISYNKIYGRYTLGTPGGPMLEKHIATVSNTYTDSGITIAINEGSQEAMLNHFTSHASSTVAENVFNQAVNDVINKVTRNALTSFSLGLVKDFYKNEIDTEFIKDTYQTSAISDAAGKFDCGGNVVTYDDGSMDVMLFEGEHTSEKVEGVDKLDNFDLTTEEVIKNPVDAYNKYKDYIKENGDKEFDEAKDD